MKLSSDKSMVLDSMHPRILRDLGYVLPRHSIIFEMSRQSGEVSGNWKKGNITHIFKKGRKEVLKNSDSLVSLSCAWEGLRADS